MAENLRELIERGIDEGVIPALMEFIRVPNLSPLYDSEWEINGRMEQAMDVFIHYIESLQINNLTHEIIKEQGKAPILFAEVQASQPGLGTVLIYGHIDKQPHFKGWIEGANNTQPAIINGKLYGRGGADDGYSIPTAALIVKTLQTLGIPHGRIVFFAENEEESGSINLKYYLTLLKDRIGDPDITLCLDSNIGDYEHFWIVNSLRGILKINVTVRMLEEGVHSGVSGITPDSFRILRHLLDRIEDSRTGEILLPELHTQIPPEIYAQAAATSHILKKSDKVSWVPGAKSVTDDLTIQIINQTWKPTLCITGAEGIPNFENAGDQVRPYTSVRLSIRIPPGINGLQAQERVTQELIRDPPYGAQIEIHPTKPNSGWRLNPLSPWLSKVTQKVSQEHFGKEALYLGGGGSIHLIGMLAETFPKTELLVIGITNIDSHTHSCNENLRIDYLKSFSCCVASIIAEHAKKNTNESQIDEETKDPALDIKVAELGSENNAGKESINKSSSSNLELKVDDKPQDSNTEVFVRNLSYIATEDDLKSLFSPCGEIENIKILKDESGYSKGIAFIKFIDSNGSNNALQLNNTSFMGRDLSMPLSKSYAIPPKINKNLGTTVFVTLLSIDSSLESIAQFFSTCGAVKDVRILLKDGKSRGISFVEFSTQDAAEKAIQLNGSKLDGKSIKIEYTKFP